MKRSHYSYLMMGGHICADINQGALPAILPFLVASGGINYTSAAGLIFAANFVSSIVQPLFGFLGDRVSRPWLTALGVLLAGSGLSVVGFLDNYWTIFIAVSISGIGVALFHPEGGRLANLVSGKKKGTGMSIFSVGGNLGFAFGPMIASISLTCFGLRGTGVFLIPAVLMSAWLFSQNKSLKNLTQEFYVPAGMRQQVQRPDNWSAFSKLSVVIFCRSIISYGLTTFMPLYWIGVLLQSEGTASTTLTIYALAGAAATLCGGVLADRFGFTRIIRIGFTLLPPLLFVLTQTRSVWLASLLLIPISFALTGPNSTMVLLGQEFLPNRIGLASGMTMGLAVSVGGMAAPGLGWIGDNYGLTHAMYVIAGISVLAMLLAYRIPKPSTAEAEA